jgi:hypothetical protein
MHFLERVANAYSLSEAPARFFYWSAAAALAATVKKNVYLDRAGVFNQYPNIYVFIVGRSGIKKGIPVTTGRILAEKAGVNRVLSGRMSFQKMIQDLGKAYTLEGGKIIKEAHALLVSGELSSLFIKDSDAMNVLTDLFNTHENEKSWVNSLKSTNTDTLKSPCISLLAATNEELFPEAVQSKDVQGGFIARTFIIYSDDSACINPLTRRNGNVPNLDDLAQHLKDIKDVKGEFIWEDDAALVYESWYESLMTQLQKKLVHDPTGTYGRLGDQMLKLAMIISLANDDSLRLRKEHIEESISECELCCKGMKHVTIGRGKSTEGSAMRMIIKALIDIPDHKLTREQLLSRYWGDISVFDIDRIAETMQAAGAINIQNNGKIRTYCLKPNALDLYVNFKKQIF